MRILTWQLSAYNTERIAYEFQKENIYRKVEYTKRFGKL